MILTDTDMLYFSGYQKHCKFSKGLIVGKNVFTQKYILCRLSKKENLLEIQLQTIIHLVLKNWVALNPFYVTDDLFLYPLNTKKNFGFLSFLGISEFKLTACTSQFEKQLTKWIQNWELVLTPRKESCRV